MNFKEQKNGIVKKNRKILLKILLVLCFSVVLTGLVSTAVYFTKKIVFQGNSVQHLKSAWNEYDYRKVYEISSAVLEQRPFNNTALTYKGYASFFLSLSENDTSKSLLFLDEAIINLRLALQDARTKTSPQIEYMLGKSYFFKNSISSFHYYSDLAVEYLKRSVDHGYKSDDIYEYLGLSYASLDMTMESISAFTKALLTRESDLLLLSIGEQYYKAGQLVAAEQYLFRISRDCQDENITDKSHLLLGKIYTEQKKYDEAENEFMIILENKENSADAYYGLGVICERRGDIIKARSYWRKALRIQVNHPESLRKLAEYK